LLCASSSHSRSTTICPHTVTNVSPGSHGNAATIALSAASTMLTTALFFLSFLRFSSSCDAPANTDDIDCCPFCGAAVMDSIVCEKNWTAFSWYSMVWYPKVEARRMTAALTARVSVATLAATVCIHRTEGYSATTRDSPPCPHGSPHRI